MKRRTQILFVFLLTGAGVSGYDHYLAQVRSKPSCEAGNAFMCADQIEALRLRHLGTQNQIVIDEKACDTEGVGFCQNAVDNYLLQIQNTHDLHHLQGLLTCQYSTPLTILYQNCLKPAFPDDELQLRSKVETNLSRACEGGAARQASCERALKFNEQHPEFRVDRAKLLTDACNLHVGMACEAGLREALGAKLTEAAARDFVMRFSSDVASAAAAPIETLGSDCRTDPRLYEVSHRKVQQFDAEIEKPQDDKFALSTLAREAYILNCRDSQARLRLAVAQAMLGNVLGARKLLARVEHGQKEFVDNPRLESLRSECSRVRDIQDPWCLELLRTKFSYKTPNEVKKLLSRRVAEVRKLFLEKKLTALRAVVHPTVGLTYVDLSDDSEPVHSKPLKLRSKSDVAAFSKYVARAEKFLKKGKLLYDGKLTKAPERPTLVADFNVLGGHHAGNYSGLHLEFQQLKSTWYLSLISFPRDYTP